MTHTHRIARGCLAGLAAACLAGTAAACPADFNHDGFVDGIDADQFNNAFDAGDLSADFNGDGFVDGIDYDQFMNAFETECTPLPDFIVSDIQGPPGLMPGQDFSLPFTVRNIGDGVAAGAVWCNAHLSINAVLGDGDDAWLGEYRVDIPGPLNGYGDSFVGVLPQLHVPPNVAWGIQHLFVSVDTKPPPFGEFAEHNEANNRRWDLVQVGPEIAVTAVTPPTQATSGDWVPVTVTIRNLGPGFANVPFSVCINSGVKSKCNTTGLVTVGPFGTVNRTLDVEAPESPGNCGGADPATVTACVNFADSNIANNCLDTQMNLIDLYYDLEFDLRNQDGGANVIDDFYRPGTLTYDVWIWNRGNSPSPNVKWRTGLVRDPGSDDYLPYIFFYGNLDTGVIQPGTHATFDRFGVVEWSATPGTRWLKAEVDYPNGGVDHCEPAQPPAKPENNFVQESVIVH